MNDDAPEIEIRRSSRRRRTVQARLEGDKIVVLVPAHLSAREEARLVGDLVERLQARRRPRRGHRSDAELLSRAARLACKHLPTAPAPTSVRWVTNQVHRWGSCTPATGEIRLSHRLQGMPAYVVDYVLLHELAHLVERNHSDRFWALLAAYPELQRARAYLDGAAFAAGWSVEDATDGEPVENPSSESEDVAG